MLALVQGQVHVGVQLQSKFCSVANYCGETNAEQLRFANALSHHLAWEAYMSGQQQLMRQSPELWRLPMQSSSGLVQFKVAPRATLELVQSQVSVNSSFDHTPHEEVQDTDHIFARCRRLLYGVRV